MAARKSSVEEDTIDVNSLRSFTIPKKKKSKRELFETIALNSREFQHELLPIFEKHLKEKDGTKNFSFISARLVHNDELLNSYLQRRKEMRRNGYTDKDVQDTFAFLYSEVDYQIRQICEHGVKVGNVSSSVLGNPEMGVSLCRHPDLSRPSPFVKNRDGQIIIFKFMKGKVKMMAENRGGVPLDPQPNYDCHISKQTNTIDNTMPQQTAYESTQYYLFEYGDFDLEERPRQVYPYAVLQFKFVGEPKLAPKILLTKSVSVPKTTSGRPLSFPSQSILSRGVPVSPHPCLSQQPSVEIRNDPRRKRLVLQNTPMDEPPIMRVKPNENDPRLRPRAPQKIINQSSLIQDPKPNPITSVPKKVARVGHVGSEVDSGGIVVWNGSLKNKDIHICPADIVVFGDPVKPVRLGSQLNVNKRLSLDGIKRQYFMGLTNLPKNKEIKHNNHYYCYAELRPTKDNEEKFSRLLLYLSKKSVAVLSPLADHNVLVLLANSGLTQFLGLNVQETPRNILHCVFVSAFSRKSLAFSKNSIKLSESMSSPLPSPAQSKSLPSPSSLISYTPSPSTPAPSPDSSGAGQRAPLLNPELVSQTFSGQSFEATPRDTSSMSVSSPGSVNSWSLPPSPSVFSSPSPADSQNQYAEQDIYNDGYQKFVPVDSLIYRKNLTKAFLDQTLLQDKRNIDVARRRASVGQQGQQQYQKPIDGTALEIFTNRQASYSNSNVKIPLSMSGLGLQISGVKVHPASSQNKVANSPAMNAGMYVGKSTSIIGPLGQVIEPISPAGSASSSCASPAPNSPYPIITMDGNSLVDQLQQQLHRKMSPIKDVDAQLRISPAKADQLQQQLHQKMSPLRPPPSPYGEVSSIAVGQVNLSSSYHSPVSHLSVPGSPQVTSVSQFLSPEIQQAASPGMVHSLDSRMSHATNTALPNVQAMKVQQNPSAQTTPGISVPRTVNNLGSETSHPGGFAVPLALDPRKAGPGLPCGPGPGTPHGPGPGLLQSLGLAEELKLSHSIHNANIPVSESVPCSLQSPLRQHQQCSMRPASLYPCNQQSQHSVVQKEPIRLGQEVTQSIVGSNQVEPKVSSDPRLARHDVTLQPTSSGSYMANDQNVLPDLSTSGASILQNILTMAKRDPAPPNAEALSQPPLVGRVGIPSRNPRPSNDSSLLMVGNTTLETSQNLVQSLSVGATSLTAKCTPVAGASVSQTNSRTINTSAKLMPSTILMSNGNSRTANSMSNNISTVSSGYRPVLSTMCSSSNGSSSNSLEVGLTKPCQTGRLITESDSSTVISATWQGSESNSVDDDDDDDDAGRLTSSSMEGCHSGQPYDPLGVPQDLSENDSNSVVSPPRVSLSDIDDLKDDFNEIVCSPLLSRKVSAMEDSELKLSDDLINLIVRSQPLAAKAARELREQIHHIEEQSKQIKRKNKLVEESLSTEQSDVPRKHNTTSPEVRNSSVEPIPQSRSTAHIREDAVKNRVKRNVPAEVDHGSLKRQCWSPGLEQNKVCLKSLTAGSVSGESSAHISDAEFTSIGKVKSCDLKVNINCDSDGRNKDISVLESPTFDQNVYISPATPKVKEIPMDVLVEDIAQGKAAETSIKYARELLYYNQLYEKSSNQQLLALGLDYVSVRFLGGARVHRLQENNELCVVKEIRKSERDKADYLTRDVTKEDALQKSVNIVLHEMSNKEETDEYDERVLLCQIALHYLLPLGQAPDEERREVLDDSGDSQPGSSCSGSQGLLNKVSSPIEYHHLNKRHLQTKQDEEEKQEIFHIYKKHRDLADVLRYLSSQNFHSRHTRPLHTIFSGPFSKRDSYQKSHHPKKTSLVDLSLVKEERSRKDDDDDKVYSSSDGEHPLKWRQLTERVDGTPTTVMFTKEIQQRQHKPMFTSTKGKLETSRNKCSENAALSTSSSDSDVKYSKQQLAAATTPVIPTHMSVTEIPSSPR